MSVQGESDKDRKNIELATFTGTAIQQWAFAADGTDWYIKNRQTGKSWKLKDNETSDGTNLI